MLNKPFPMKSILGLLGCMLVYRYTMRSQLESQLKHELNGLKRQFRELSYRLQHKTEHGRNGVYFNEDLPTQFNVHLQNRVIRHPSLAEATYKSQPDESEINQNFGFYTDIVDEPDRRMSIRWVGPEYGFGVFAEMNIPVGTFLSIYGGIVSADTQDTMYAWTHVDMQMNNQTISGVTIDARHTGNMMRFVNHDDNPNVQRVSYFWRDQWQIAYVLVRPVRKDEQIYVSYGKDYWASRSTVKAGSKRETT